MRNVFQEIAYYQIDPTIQCLRAADSVIEKAVQVKRPLAGPIVSGAEANFAFAGLLRMLGNWNDFSRSTGPLSEYLQGYVLPSSDAQRMYSLIGAAFKEAFPQSCLLDRHDAVKKLTQMVGDIKAAFLSREPLSVEQAEGLLKKIRALRMFLQKFSSFLEDLETATAA